MWVWVSSWEVAVHEGGVGVEVLRGIQDIANQYCVRPRPGPLLLVLLVRVFLLFLMIFRVRSRPVVLRAGTVVFRGSSM